MSTPTPARLILPHPVYLRDLYGMDVLRVEGVNVIQTFDATLNRWVRCQCLTEDEREQITAYAHMTDAERIKALGYRAT